MLRRLAIFVGYRSLEWLMVGCFFGIFVEMLVIPDLVRASVFRYMVAGKTTPSVLAIVFLLTSYLRAVALILNGRSYYYGPYLRALGALVGAVLWSMMTISMIRIVLDKDYLSQPVSIPVYVVMALAELFTAYRAAGDVRDMEPEPRNGYSN